MTTIKFRRDTSTNWTQANPIPAQGEPCYETDTGKLKIGNGSDSYTNLAYVSDGGTSGGTTDYTQLENKPQINSIELSGNKTLDDLGIQAKGDYATTADIPTKTSELTNDSGFLTGAPDNMVTTDTAQTITGSKTFSSATVSDTIYLGKSLTFNGTNTTINSINDIYGGWQSGSNLSLTNYATLTGNTGLKVQTYSGDITIGGRNSSGLIQIANGSETVNVTSGSGGIALSGGDGGISIYSDTTFKSGSKIKLNSIANNKYLSLGSSSYGGLDIRSTSTESQFIYMSNSTNSSLSIGRTGITITDGVDGVTRNFIDSSNIDTTYMKWSSGKLTVDTAAVAHLAMPSTTTVSLTLGASGTTYTAPADGWFLFRAPTTSAVCTYMDSCVLTSEVITSTASSAVAFVGMPLVFTHPASNGAILAMWYNATFASVGFTFIYCNGSVPSS